MDRFCDDLEIELSSYSMHDDYNEEDEEMEGDYEEEEVNDVEKTDELACPFCTEDFDVLGLCCHIDADHRMEVKPGICPVCTTKVRINMASHVITQHESILKTLCNKTNRSNRSRSAIYLLRKELQEKHTRSIKESHSVDSSCDPAAETMLMSFVNNPKPAFRPQTVEAAASTEASLSGKNSPDDSSLRYAKIVVLSNLLYFLTQSNADMLNPIVDMFMLYSFHLQIGSLSGLKSIIRKLQNFDIIIQQYINIHKSQIVTYDVINFTSLLEIICVRGDLVTE